MNGDSRSSPPSPDAPQQRATSYHLFQEPWWLDAVAPGAWREIVLEDQGRIVARWPYVERRRWGVVAVTQPPLTPTLGPWLAVSGIPTSPRLAREKELMSQLIQRLPRFDLFRQGFAPALTNWLPFFWQGFEQTTRYTYRIEDLSDLDRVFAQCEGNVRQNVRKAEKQVTVRDDLGIETYIRLVRTTYARKQREMPTDENLIRRIDAACRSRQAHRLLFAEDAQQRVHAALLMVYDDRCAYYLGGGLDPAHASSGAMTLLMWRAIQAAAQVAPAYDFEGSMQEPIERFFRKFATVQTPYFLVTKYARKLAWLARLRKIV